MNTVCGAGSCCDPIARGRRTCNESFIRNDRWQSWIGCCDPRHWVGMVVWGYTELVEQRESFVYLPTWWNPPKGCFVTDELRKITSLKEPKLLACCSKKQASQQYVFADFHSKNLHFLGFIILDGESIEWSVLYNIMKAKLEEIYEAHVIDGRIVVPRKKHKLRSVFGEESEHMLLPNLNQVVNFFSVVAEGFLLEGDKEKALELFELIMRYVEQEATKYHRGELGYSWKFHSRFFKCGSPCCTCDIKQYMSSWACRNGFSDLGRRVVLRFCPASPPGYSPSASTSEPRSKEDAEQREKWTREMVERWDGVEYCYFWKPHGVFMGA